METTKSAEGVVTATGVQFSVNNSSYTVKAKKEVIVCGGVINSPQILELSGIGNKDILQKAGVDVVVDLPGVGENLNDHTASGLSLVSHPLFILIKSIKYYNQYILNNFTGGQR